MSNATNSIYILCIPKVNLNSTQRFTERDIQQKLTALHIGKLHKITITQYGRAIIEFSEIYNNTNGNKVKERIFENDLNIKIFNNYPNYWIIERKKENKIKFIK